MTERMNRQPDKIIKRQLTTNDNGERIISREQVLMELPKLPATYKTDAVLPPGITLLDLMPMQPHLENPHLTILGEAVGEEKKPVTVPLVDGEGVIQISNSEEVVIYAKDLTQRLQDLREQKEERAKRNPTVRYLLRNP